MATVQGTVKWVSDEKKYNNYSFRLEEDDDNWYRSKKRMEGVLEPGNIVKLSVKKGKPGSFELTGAPELVGKAEPAQPSGGSGGFDRQSSIVLQSSRNAAIEAATLLASQGAVKLSKTKPEANKAILLDLIDELTASFYVSASDPASFLETRPESGFEREEEEDESEGEEESGSDPDWD